MTLKSSLFADIRELGATKGAGDYTLVIRSAVTDFGVVYSCRLEHNGKVLRTFDESTINLSDGATLMLYREAFESALGYLLKLELVESFAALDAQRIHERLERAWDAAGHRFEPGELSAATDAVLSEVNS